MAFPPPPKATALVPGTCLARAWHRNRPKGTASRSLVLEPELDEREILGRRDLEEARVAGDDRHPPGARLDERCAVARPGDVSLERRAEHVGRERLRRLDDS